MISLRQVATAAGVSPATVSLALRGKGGVSRATAEHVRRLARELGYRPNPLLASLASKSFHQDSISRGAPVAIFHFPNAPGLEPQKSPIYSKALMDEATALGYAPQEFLISPETDPVVLSRTLDLRMGLGIIITGNPDFAGFGRKFPWDNYSIVQCARYHSSQPVHTVRPNIFQGVKMVFDQILVRGYQRIGFAIAKHRLPMEDDTARFGAAIAMESDFLPRTRRVPVFRGQIGDSEGFLKWIQANTPDAVVGFSSEYLGFLEAGGFSVPEDIGFASLHIWNARLTACSGLDQSPAIIARESVQLMDHLIRRKERGLPQTPLQVLVPSQWIEGRTLRPLVE